VNGEPSDTGRFSATIQPGWTRSPGATMGAVVAIMLVGLGLILGRIDVSLLGLPLAVATAFSWARRPPAGDVATATIAVGDSNAGELDYTIAIEPPRHTETVVIRHSVLNGSRHEFAVSGREASDLAGTVPLLHSGPQELVRIEYRLLGAEGMAASTAEDPLIAERVVAPSEVKFDALPLPPRLQGLTGQHQSARAGDGGEFRDVHPFTTGDRLRRIDWKATARRGQNAGDLYVRRTNALADATVLIVLDSRDDVGQRVAEWSRNTASRKGLSSLDVAREAATSIATAYIRSGDRVGFQDLASRARMVTHAGGSRHLWKLLRAIEVTEPSQVRFDHQRAPIVPPGALVYLLSSLLDDRSVQMALRWRANGHRVIAVNVLPTAQFDQSTRFERIAHRMVMMERDDRIRILRARGIELLSWRDETARLPLQARLQLLSRPVRAGAPR
jgi:uncharacterized protein (DUF58 family)